LILDIDETDLKKGILGLVVALVEIVKEALRLQALNRMEGGSLTEEEVERLGEALMNLDIALDQMKAEMGIAESVKSIRDDLDRVADELVGAVVYPGGLGTTDLRRTVACSPEAQPRGNRAGPLRGPSSGRDVTCIASGGLKTS
jgi:hypothetical protein